MVKLAEARPQGKLVRLLDREILPRNWRDVAEGIVNRTVPRDERPHVLRILNSDDAEVALRYLLDAAGGKLDLNILLDAIQFCACFLLPHARDRRRDKSVADSLRIALTEHDFLFRGPGVAEAVETASSWYSMLATPKSGNPGAPSKLIIIDLALRFEHHFGRPVWEAIAALLRAAIPKKDWDTATVRRMANRYIRPAK